jgi:peptide/nickel transport system substrate-binding protein
MALLLLFAVACGAAATATPTPAATKAPAPAVAPAVPAAAPAAAPTPTKAPTAAPAPTPVITPAASPQVSAGRLKVAALPGEENNDPHGAAGTALVPLRNIYEYLVEIEPYKGAHAPMLTTEWKISPDGKAWTVKLRKGVQFHRGYGEFTAQDLVHTYKRLTRDGSLSTLTGYWRANLDNIEIVNDYEAVFHMKRVELEWQHQVSTSWDGVMLSKAQFDKEGQEGFAAKPAGTGPYQFVERRIGTAVSFERVPYAHWRIRPDFKELEFLIVREELTRLAMLLTGEAHIAEISLRIPSSRLSPRV